MLEIRIVNYVETKSISDSIGIKFFLTIRNDINIIFHEYVISYNKLFCFYRNNKFLYNMQTNNINLLNLKYYVGN